MFQHDKSASTIEQQDPAREPATDTKPSDEAMLGRQPHAQAGTGVEAKTLNLLSYFVMPVGGLIVYFASKDREVRFHAAQSILLYLSFFAASIGLSMFQFAPVNLFFVVLTAFIGIIALLGFMVLWIVMCIKGYKQQHFKLPLIGGIAERWAAR
jgi:uncharacterized membrane protein